MLADMLINLLPASKAHVERTILHRVREAYAHVPLYRELLAARGLTPKDFRNLADYVENFPRTSSGEYRRVKKERGDEFVLDRRFVDRPVRRLLTGGSSGTPAHILRTEREYRRMHGANTVYTFLCAGVRPWHRIMGFLPPWDIVQQHHPLQRMKILERFDASFLDSADTIIDRIVKNRVNVLFGRVSMMRMVAERCLERGLVLPRMAVLLPGAEIVTPDARRLLRAVFKPRLYRELYGSTETGVLALKKDEGAYKVNFRSVFFALTDPVAAEDGTVWGEIAVTALLAAAAPMLMIELGDVVCCRRYEELLALKTSIVTISGRVSEYVLGGAGEKISASAFYSWLSDEPLVRQYRIVQDRIGACDIFLRLGDCSPEDRGRLVGKLRAMLGTAVRPSFHFVGSIPFDANGKTRVVVNRIAPS
jgi:phenylacetate-coenzyme A ligase PaaK-like adenylate-forming protein